MARRSLTPAMQAAAVREAVNAGSTLDEIAANHVQLKEGVALVRQDGAAPPAPAGSGSVRQGISRRTPPGLI